MLCYSEEVLVTKVDADGKAEVFYENLDENEVKALSVKAVDGALAKLGASEIESGKVSGQTVPDDEIKRLETLIDEWNAILPPWRGFVLPGGIESASRAQVCRTVCRRAERHIHLLAETELVPSEVMQYMNRLSDLLFVMALRENFLAGKEEIIWRKRGQ